MVVSQWNTVLEPRSAVKIALFVTARAHGSPCCSAGGDFWSQSLYIVADRFLLVVVVLVLPF
jgi:hypothetical protein